MAYKPKVLSPADGGTGIANNSASTLAISGAFASTFTVTNTTAVTFPTSGTLATTSQLPSITATQFDVLVGGAANAIASVGPGSAGQVLQSGGNAANPAYSTATYPATAGTSGNVLTSNGTNWTSAAPAASGGFEIHASYTTTNPSDATTVYLQAIGSVTTQNASTRFYFTKSYTITKLYGVNTVAGTLGSSENTTFSIRLNNTTDTTVTSTLKFDATSTTFNNTSLSISVVAGDFIEFKLAYPTWVTNPTSVAFSVSLFVS